MMTVDSNRAFYGIKHVEYAADKAAIETLMITDELFRAQDVQKRLEMLHRCSVV